MAKASQSHNVKCVFVVLVFVSLGIFYLMTNSAIYDVVLFYTGFDENDVRGGHDGSFVEILDPGGDIYIYSAFWDDRWSVPVSIRVIALLSCTAAETPSLFVHCHLAGKNNTQPFMERYKAEPLKLIGPTFGMFFGQKRVVFGRYVVTCPVPEEPVDILSDLRITLRFQNATDTALKYTVNSSVPVEFPLKVADEDVKEFATCFSVGYGGFDPVRIVEWVEMQRLLGVAHIIVYNGSMHTAPSVVLRHYEARGDVEIRQMNPIHSIAWKDMMLRQVIGINDCLYRYMYQYKYIMFLDLDEVIVPRKSSTLHDLVKDIQNIQLENEPIKDRNIYQFRTMSFVADEVLTGLPDKSKPSIVHYVRYRRRLPVFGVGMHLKLILDPMGCKYLFMHYCRGITEGFQKQWRLPITVDPDIGALYHYRDTECARGIDKCTKSINVSTVAQDDSMLRFEEQLVLKVQQQLDLLRSNPEYQKLETVTDIA